MVIAIKRKLKDNELGLCLAISSFKGNNDKCVSGDKFAIATCSVTDYTHFVFGRNWKVFPRKVSNLLTWHECRAIVKWENASKTGKKMIKCTVLVCNVELFFINVNFTKFLFVLYMCSFLSLMNTSSYLFLYHHFN